jgi:uncharacterized membrane protein
MKLSMSFSTLANFLNNISIVNFNEFQEFFLIEKFFQHFWLDFHKLL